VKNLPSALLTFLQSNVQFGRADLFKILLANGSYIYATDCQVALAYGGHAYDPTLYGAWKRGAVRMEATFDLKAGDMDLTGYIPATVLFPGTEIPMMQCVTAGLFDAATVTVYTAYWALGSAPSTSLGVETKFVGRILNFQQTGRSQVQFKVADLLYMLELKTPPNLIQANCRFTFGDANCGFDLSTVTVSNSVAAGSTMQTINLGSAVTASVYAQGFIKFTSGQNNGLTLAIKSQPSATQIVLAGQTPLLLEVGDTFTMTQGCNKAQSRCSQLFGPTYNIHYGGQDFMPNPETAL